MPYVTLQQLAERPGALDLAALASPEHEAVVAAELMDATLRSGDRSAWSAEERAAADAAVARIQDAVAEADALIDGFLCQRGYTLPLDLTPLGAAVVMLSGWSRAITRYLLSKNRISDESKDPVARDYRDALKLLRLVAEGKFGLGLAEPVQSASSTDVRFDGAPNVFGRDQLGAFR